MSIQNPENPRRWRYTWEAQSHSPTLRLYLFDSQTKPSIQCRNLNANLILSRSLLLVTWMGEKEEERDAGDVSLRIPIPKVLVDTESPVNCRALDDHIEVKLLLLLPVDHPIVSSFESVLNLSEDVANEVSETGKPLLMDSDLKSLSSIKGVHFYCRSCSSRLTRNPLGRFLEMPSVNWREVADNWFGACCCSFGGISEKLVTRYANSYSCEKGLCLLNVATVTLKKDDLVECGLPEFDMNQKYQCEQNPSAGDGIGQEIGTGCDNQSGSAHICNSDQIDNASLAEKIKSEDTAGGTNGDQLSCEAALSNFSEYVESASGCCVYTTSHRCSDVDEVCTHDASKREITESMRSTENEKSFLNGFLGNVFMAKSSYLSMNIKWVEFACPQCSSVLGAYPCGDGDALIDGGVRLFKCYISTSLPVGGSSDLFRKYTLERMFTNQLVESAKDELSFRTVVRDLATKSPMLQVVLLNSNSWFCTGYCLGREDVVESGLNLHLVPVVKVLFSDCTSRTESQLRMIENWLTKNLADEVFILKSQVEELIGFLASANKLFPPSGAYLQGLPISLMQR